MKKIILATMIISLLSAGCNKNETSEIKRPVVSGISTINIAKSLTDEYYTTSATVNSKINSVVSSMIMGRVTSLKVKEGDRVKAGQLLLTIDSRDTAQKALGARAGISEAQKAVEAANQNKKLINKTYERYKNLYIENVMTKQEFDTVATQKKLADIEYQRALLGVTKAKAGLGEVGVYESYSSVTSPISGVVIEKNIDTGSTAIPGQPLLTIESPSNLELVANIDESLVNKVSIGMPVYLETDNQRLQSHITSIIPDIDSITRTFKVKIALSGLTSGQYVKVKIPVSKKETIFVPKSSIVEKGELTGVYTVDDKNIISYRLIRTGKASNGNVEVLSGLSTGDKVITSGVDKAVDGGEIK